MLGRIRLLPVLIFFAAMLLTVKVVEVWQGAEVIARGVAVAPVSAAAPAAQTQAAQPAAEGAAQPGRPAQPKPTIAEQTSPVPRPRGPDDLKDPVMFSQSEIELLQRLSQRRKEIDAREEAVVQREILLKATEERFQAKVTELTKLRGEIDVLIKKYDEQEEVKLRNTVKIYENMKPKDASRIFEELDIKVLLEVVARMKEAKLAPILALMNPQKAMEVTTKMLDRKQIPAVPQVSQAN
jgi:flagellar motility protein MotE (MotC chaperone)